MNNALTAAPEQTAAKRARFKVEMVVQAETHELVYHGTYNGKPVCVLGYCSEVERNLQVVAQLPEIATYSPAEFDEGEWKIGGWDIGGLVLNDSDFFDHCNNEIEWADDPVPMAAPAVLHTLTEAEFKLTADRGLAVGVNAECSIVDSDIFLFNSRIFVYGKSTHIDLFKALAEKAKCKASKFNYQPISTFPEARADA